MASASSSVATWTTHRIGQKVVSRRNSVSTVTNGWRAIRRQAASSSSVVVISDMFRAYSVSGVSFGGVGFARSLRIGGGRMARHAEPLVEIGADDGLQIVDAVLEEMVRLGDHRVLDQDALLGLQLLDQRQHLLERRDAVLVAMDEQAGRRAGGEEAEVEPVGRRGDGDEALDLRPAHQELHADPGAERDAGDPAGARLRADGLRPVEGGGGVRQLPLAVVERALGAPDAAEVEAQNGEAAIGEVVVRIVDDLVVHRPAELRMRVQNHGDRRAPLLGGMETAFQPTGGTVEEDFWHADSKHLSGGPGVRRLLLPVCRGRRGLRRGRRARMSRLGRREARLGGRLIARKAPEIARKNRSIAQRSLGGASIVPVGDGMAAARPITRTYLDYNATAPVRPEARAAAILAMETTGNPSSVHAEGRAARRIVEDARAEVGRLAGVPARCVTFVSGATEAVNAALNPHFGVGPAAAPLDRLIVAAGEHPAALQGHRFPASAVEIAPLGADGRIDLDGLSDACRKPGRALLALQAANNETGVIQPVAEAAAIVRAAGGFVFCDAVQLAGRAAFSLASLSADALALSSHKIGGPKGAGRPCHGDSRRKASASR